MSFAFFPTSHNRYWTADFIADADQPATKTAGSKLKSPKGDLSLNGW